MAVGLGLGEVGTAKYCVKRNRSDAWRRDPGFSSSRGVEQVGGHLKLRSVFTVVG